jgi:influenza virus NS1A-binding protein
MFKRENCALVKGPDSNLYSIGGYDGEACLNICELFSTQLFKWEKICPMLTQSRSLSCTVMPDGIYVMGGYDGKQYLSHCEKYLIN